MKKWVLIILLFAGCSTGHQAQEAVVEIQKTLDFSKMHFGCDGNSITAGNQWSKTVVDILGFATHHNVAVGSAKWASYIDTQEYGSTVFAGISGGWEPTDDEVEIQKRHNNVSKVHIQKFISEVENGSFPAPDVFVFSMGTNDTKIGSASEVLKEKRLDKVDLTTMAGGARWCIQTIIERFPKCRVFLCTPIQSGSISHNELNLKKIAVLREICSTFSVPVIDCYSECGIRAEDEIWGGRGRYLKDGLHPDVEGQQLMGRYIAKKIQNYLGVN
mgnify:FL=1